MRKSFGQNTKKIIAASLVFWMSGILFLFCCETARVEAAEAESCPLAKASHCHKQSSKQTAGGGGSQSVSIEPAQHAVDCCRFLPHIFGQSASIEKNQKIVSTAAAIKVLQPKFSIINRQFFAPKNFQSVVINRAETYLKNCVFRI